MHVLSLIIMNCCGFIPLVAARVVFTLHALSFGASPFQIGMLAVVNQLFTMLLSMPIGAYADRHGARGLFLVGMLSAVAALMLPYWFPGMPALFASSALIGLWAVMIVVLTQSLVGVLSTPEAVTRNYTNLTMFGSVAMFIGPLVAGFAIDAVGLELAWLALVPFMLIPLGWLAAHWRALPAGRARAAARTSHGTLLRERSLWWLLVLSGMVQLCSDLYPFYLPMYGHSVGLSAGMIGAVVASVALASFTARVLMQPLVQLVGEERLLSLSLALCAVGFALVPLFASPVALVLVSMLYGAASSAGQPITMTMMFRSSPPGRVAEAIGLRIMGNGVMRAVAPGAFGGIAALAGLTSMFVSTGALIGAVALANFWKARAGRVEGFGSARNARGP